MNKKFVLNTANVLSETNGKLQLAIRSKVPILSFDWTRNGMVSGLSRYLAPSWIQTVLQITEWNLQEKRNV